MPLKTPPSAVAVVKGVPVASAVVSRSRGSGWEALAVVGSAALFAVISLLWSCWVRSWCVSAGTCTADATSNRSLLPVALQCNFRNNVPLIADVLYHPRPTLVATPVARR